jgi:DNA-binding CsgD family transcriptional regulator
MTHLTIFLLILSLPLGLAAAARVLQAYRKYRHRYLLAYGLLLLLTNFSIFLSLIKNYTFANLLVRNASAEAVLVESSYRLTGMIAQLIILFIYIYLLTQLLQVKLHPLFKRIYAGIAILIIAPAIAIAASSVITVTVLPILNMNVVFGLCMDAAGIILIVLFLLKIKGVQEKNKRKALTVFALFYLIPSAVIALFAFLHVFTKLSNNILLTGSLIFIYAVYSATLVYLRWFMETYHGKLEIAHRENQHLETLYNKYNISKREQEIILLICEGKSNKEIEEELFISLQTVKDHIYNIYRKTGVKNRVQLSNLFQGKKSKKSAGQ